MKFYKATDRDGGIHTRSTENRTYSHAVVFRWTSRYYADQEERIAASWAGRLELAQKEAGNRRHRDDNSPPEIIPAVEISGAEYRAILKGTPR